MGAAVSDLENGVSKLDGPSTVLHHQMAPPGCDRATNDRAFAVLCMAAWACAARHHDVLDLGKGEMEGLRMAWTELGFALHQMAEWACKDARRTDGEDDRGENWTDYLEAIWEAGR